MTHTAESLQAAFKYLWLEEVAAIKQLAQSLPNNPVVVNIGAGAGTSGLAFMESRKDLWLITIDIESGDSPFGSLLAEQRIIKDSLGVTSDFQRFTQIALDSVGVGNHWPPPGPIFPKRVDLVFIDGDHSYGGCKGDIEAWLPNIKPGGIIAIHDYKKSELYAHEKDYKDSAPHPKDWPGVDKAVDELLVGKYEQVLRVKSLIAFRI